MMSVAMAEAREKGLKRSQKISWKRAFELYEVSEFYESF
jgi:hypothetical protein